MYRSPDLAHWKWMGWALRKAPGFWASDLFWAPEVRAYRGKFYMVYSGMVAGLKTPKIASESCGEQSSGRPVHESSCAVV